MGNVQDPPKVQGGGDLTKMNPQKATIGLGGGGESLTGPCSLAAEGLATHAGVSVIGVNLKHTQFIVICSNTPVVVSIDKNEMHSIRA